MGNGAPAGMVEVKKHGRDPQTWGPYKWREEERYIDSLPSRPEEDPRGALDVAFVKLYNLGCYLPCKECRCHYEEARDDVLGIMARKGIGLASRVTRTRLHIYWWMVHDRANIRLNKPMAQRLSWAQYAAKYNVGGSA